MAYHTCRLSQQTDALTQAAASSELMHHLSSARDALVKFNQLIFPNTQNGGEVTSPQLNHPSSSSYPSDFATQQIGPPSNNDTIPRSRKELHVEDSYPPFTSPSSPTTTMFDPLSSSGECCGGIMDCDELCEDEDSQLNMTLTRTSDIRSTTA